MDFSIHFTFASNIVIYARENTAFPKCFLTANFTESDCSISSKAKCILSVNACPPFDPLPGASGRKGSRIVSEEGTNEVDGKIKNDQGVFEQQLGFVRALVKKHRCNVLGHGEIIAGFCLC